MDIDREKELYSQIEGLRGQMEGLYDEIARLKKMVPTGEYVTAVYVSDPEQIESPPMAVFAYGDHAQSWASKNYPARHRLVKISSVIAPVSENGDAPRD